MANEAFYGKPQVAQSVKGTSMGIRLIMLAALMSFPNPVGAAVLFPVSKWTPYFTEKQCLVRRRFGDPARPMDIYLKRPAIGDIIQLSVVRRGYARKSERLPARVTLDGRALPPTTAFITTVLSDKVRWHVINLPLSEFQNPPSVATIRVKTEGVDETFSVPGFALILGMLDDCVTKLRTTWHVDASGAPLDLQQAPQIEVGSGVFSASDYPASALINGAQGDVTVTYLVAESGRVVDCMIVNSAGSPDLDGRSCAIIIDRAKFRPAVGVDGKPAKSAGIQRVAWRIR